MDISMFRKLRALFGPPPQSAPAASDAGAAPHVEPAAPTEEDLIIFEGRIVPAYPERGVPAPAVPPEVIVRSQLKKINALHQVSSFSRQDFDEYVLPAIYSYAAYVHLLPASESQHHSGQGGLFKHGLEVAYNASLACEATVFAYDHWASHRDKLVPRWRMCALLGGMIHDIGKPVVDVGAIDPSGDLIWTPHASSLYAWLVEHKLSEYYIHWRPGARHKRHEPFNSVLLSRIIPEKTLKWISEYGGQEPLNSLILAITGKTSPSNPLCSIISKADSKSVSKDIHDSRIRMSASGLGVSNSLAMRTSRCIHDLIQTGVWQVNKIGHNVWFTNQGIFMLPEGFDTIAQILRDKGDNSVPRDKTELIEKLKDWGHIHPNFHASGNEYLAWKVRIHAIDRGKPASFDATMVRFSNEDVIPRDMIPPEPVVLEMTDAGAGKLPATQAPQEAQVESGTVPEPVAAAAPPAATATRRPPATKATASRPATEHVTAAADLAGADSLLGRHADDGLVIASGSDGGQDLLTMDPPLQDDAHVEVRDRANELDPRDEMLLVARKQIASRWPPETPEAAAAFFQSEGTEGQVILTICNRVSSGDLVEGEHVWDIDNKVHFKFPEAFEQLGIGETEIRAMLEEKGWTERDSASPTKSTVSIVVNSGRKAVTLRITEYISYAVQMLLPARSGDTISATDKTARKRVLPMGPYIDAEIAGFIRDRVTMDPQDSPLIRPCFHQFAQKEAADAEREVSSFSAQEVHTLVQAFTKAHALSSGKWLSYHLIRGDNAWGLKADKQQGSFAFNPAYRLDRDHQELIRRGIT